MKYITETRRMDLKDFTIRDSFLKTMPSEKKMEKCRNYFKENGVLDREIIIHNGILVDGYVGYLVLRENAVEEWDIEVVAGTVPLKTYVYGKHSPNGKEFVWKAKNRIANKVKKGDMVRVNTSRGNKVITVTRIERRYEPPTELPIKTAWEICTGKNPLKLPNVYRDWFISNPDRMVKYFENFFDFKLTWWQKYLLKKIVKSQVSNQRNVL